MWPWQNRGGDPYSTHERRVYRYFDGQRIRKADPLDLYRRMMNVWPNLSIDSKVATSPSKDAPKAHDNLIQGLRELFVIKPLSEGGLSELEVVSLWDHFMLYVEDIRERFMEFADNISAFGGLSNYFRGRPTYLQHFGLWLNRRRILYRQAGAVDLGVRVALGNVDPGLAYYAAQCDGEGEAALMRANQQSSRASRAE